MCLLMFLYYSVVFQWKRQRQHTFDFFLWAEHEETYLFSTVATFRLGEGSYSWTLYSSRGYCLPLASLLSFFQPEHWMFCAHYDQFKCCVRCSASVCVLASEDRRWGWTRGEPIGVRLYSKQYDQQLVRNGTVFPPSSAPDSKTYFKACADSNHQWMYRTCKHVF